jgi:hypothetical protein
LEAERRVASFPVIICTLFFLAPKGCFTPVIGDYSDDQIASISSWIDWRRYRVLIYCRPLTGDRNEAFDKLFIFSSLFI